MAEAFDCAIHPHGKGSLAMVFPRKLSYPMMERGYNRATVTVDEDGIHIRPYVADELGDQLPEWTK